LIHCILFSSAIVVFISGGWREAMECGTLQGAAYDGRKFGILAFALQFAMCQRKFIYILIYSVH